MADEQQNPATKQKKGRTKTQHEHATFSDCVTHAVKQYFDDLDEAHTSGFYDLFIHEAEAPLLRVVMDHTHHNQSAAAQLLGLSRGTLRKKLKEHNLI